MPYSEPRFIQNCLFRAYSEYSELEASSKACQAYKMNMHVQSPGIVRTVIQPFSRVFRYIQEYWCILSHTHRRTAREKKVSLFWKERPWLCFWWNVYRSALFPQTPTTVLKHFWLRICIQALFFLQKVLS